MERRDGPSGRTLFVNQSETEIGSKGPFQVVYSDEDATGRVQCNECSNVRKPDEWDAAHE